MPETAALAEELHTRLQDLMDSDNESAKIAIAFLLRAATDTPVKEKAKKTT